MKRNPAVAGSLALLATCLAAVVVGCSSVSAQAPTPPALDGTAWVLDSLPGQALLPQTTATLQFAEGRASGTDGCNRFAGGYTVQGPKLGFGQLAGTQMACPPAVMEQARVVTAALAATQAHRMNGATLELLGADSKVVATYRAQPTGLAGTQWSATGINNGRGAVTGLVAGTHVTLEFDAGGRAAGTAGCNRYTATYEGSGQGAFKLGPAAATRMMCAAPGVMEQEQAFLAALTTVATARTEGDRLELRTADGALAASFVRAAAAH